MAAVLTTLKMLVSSDVPSNCFPWDYHMRRAQYGIVLACTVVLGIDLVVSGLECTISDVKNYEREYVNSFCGNAAWYSAEKRATDFTYNINLRTFKWMILLQPMCIIVLAYIYDFSNLQDDYINKAEDIMEIRKKRKERKKRKKRKKRRERRVKKDDDSSSDGSSDDDDDDDTSVRTVVPGSKSFFERLTRSRDFVSHYIVNMRNKKVSPVYNYCCYLILSIALNAYAATVFYPTNYQFPTAVSCQYIGQNLGRSWATCSLKTSVISNVAVHVAFACFIFGCFFGIFSFIFLFLIFPNQLVVSAEELYSFAEDAKHVSNIRKWERRYRIKSHRHCCYMLAMLYFHVDRNTCKWMLMAYMDVKNNEKEYKILNEIEKIFHITVDKAMVQRCCVKPFYRTIITDIEVIAFNVEEQQNALQHQVHIDDSKLNNDNERTDKDELNSQLDYIETNETMPLTTIGDAKVIPKRLEDWGEMIPSDYEYRQNLYNLYTLRTLPFVIEIKYCCYLQTQQDYVSDNNHAEGFEAANAFDRKQAYCWRSKDNTKGIDITRVYDVGYQMCLLAIQAPHVNVLAAPTKFSTTYGEGTSEEEKPVEHSSGMWVKDEWKLFLLHSTRNECGSDSNTKTIKRLKITMINNVGEEFYEIQNIRLFGKK